MYGCLRISPDQFGRMTIAEVNQALEGYESQWDMTMRLVSFSVGHLLMPHMKHGKSTIVKKLYKSLTNKKAERGDLSPVEKDAEKIEFWKNVRQRRYRKQKAIERGTSS